MRYKGILFSAILVITSFFVQSTLAASPIDRIKNFAVDETRSSLFIVNGDSTFSAYDASSERFTVESKLLGIQDVWGIAVSPKGTYTTFFLNEGRPVEIVVFKTDEVLKNESPVPTASYTLDHFLTGNITSQFSSDEKTLYVAYGTGNLSLFDTETKKEQKISAGNVPIGMVLDEKNHVLLLNRKTQDLSILDLPSKKIFRTLKLGLDNQQILYNPVNDLTYISDVASGEVNIIDSGQGLITKKVKVGSNPTSMAYDPENGAVFVANNGGGTLSIIAPDFSTKSVDLKSAAYFNSSPLSLYFANTARRLFILNGSEAKVLVLDVDQLKIVKEQEVGISPRAILGLEKSGKVFVRHFDANSILVMDANSLTPKSVPGEIKKPIQDFFVSPQSVSVDEENNRIYVSNVGVDFITEIDGNSQKPVGKISIGFPLQTILYSSALKKLYGVSAADNKLAVVETEHDNRVTVIPVGVQPRNFYLHDDNKKIYVSNSGDSSLSIIDALTNTVVQTVSLPKKSFPLGSTMDREMNKLYITLYGAGSVLIFDTKTNAIKKNISVGPNPLSIRRLYGVNKVAVAVGGDKKLVFIDTESDEVVRTLTFPEAPYRIFQSSDFNKKNADINFKGDQFLYVNFRKSKNIATIRLDRDPQKITTLSVEEVPYIGELDYPFNMIGFNRKSGLAYVSFGRANQLNVANIKPTNSGLEAIGYALIDRLGNVSFLKNTPNGLNIKDKIFSYAKWAVLFFLVLILSVYLIKKIYNKTA